MKATEQDHLEEKAYLELIEFRELRELAPPHLRAWEVAQRKQTINEYLKEYIDLEELSDKLDEYQDIIETDLEIRSTKPPGQATGK